MNKYIFNCNDCNTRCDGVSHKKYIFKDDLKYSEEKENNLINEINKVNGFHADKCELDGYPDVEIKYLPTGEVFYIEVKAQRRTFMSVKESLPDADLTPSETVALNLSDLKRYFKIYDEIKKPIYIMWSLENRPCIVKEQETNFYYQDINELKKIYSKYYNKRRFKRKTGKGDYVNGQHKGVIVNYHFSLNELEEFDLDKVLNQAIKDKNTI